MKFIEFLSTRVLRSSINLTGYAEISQLITCLKTLHMIDYNSNNNILLLKAGYGVQHTGS